MFWTMPTEIFFKDIAQQCSIQERVSKEILQKLKKELEDSGVKLNLSLGYTVMV
jgi:GTP cyclohydrolase I